MPTGPSISFCSHQVPRKFSSNFSCSHQVPIKFLLFPWLWRIGRSAQVSTKVNDETRERLGQSAAISEKAGRGAQWQSVVCRQSRKSGFSACQVLWKIAGRSASRMAAYRSFSFMCVTPMSEPPAPTNSSFWMDDMCSRVRPEVDDIITT
jgi:hypothetical protein